MAYGLSEPSAVADGSSLRSRDPSATADGSDNAFYFTAIVAIFEFKLTAVTTTCAVEFAPKPLGMGTFT